MNTKVNVEELLMKHRLRVVAIGEGGEVGELEYRPNDEGGG